MRIFLALRLRNPTPNEALIYGAVGRLGQQLTMLRAHLRWVLKSDYLSSGQTKGVGEAGLSQDHLSSASHRGCHIGRSATFNDFGVDDYREYISHFR